MSLLGMRPYWIEKDPVSRVWRADHYVGVNEIDGLPPLSAVIGPLRLKANINKGRDLSGLTYTRSQTRTTKTKSKDDNGGHFELFVISFVGIFGPGGCSRLDSSRLDLSFMSRSYTNNNGSHCRSFQKPIFIPNNSRVNCNIHE